MDIFKGFISKQWPKTEDKQTKTPQWVHFKRIKKPFKNKSQSKCLNAGPILWYFYVITLILAFNKLVNNIIVSQLFIKYRNSSKQRLD